MKFEDTPEWKRGDAAQIERALAMAEKGFVTVPIYGMKEVDQSTKAPVLFVHNNGLLIAPDVMMLKPGTSPIWSDVKAKSKPTWRRTHNRWEHGFDYSLWQEYHDVQTQSGAQVFIVVREVSSPVNPYADSPLVDDPKWLAISLDDAKQKGEWRKDWPGGKAEPHRRGRRGMGGLLFARKDMRLVKTHEEDLAAN